MLALRAIAAVFRAIFTTRADLMVENLALRQQLNVLRRKAGRPRLRKQDRIFWLWLARSWSDWRDSLILVKPETVVRWHRHGFKYYWTWKSRQKGGRPAVAPEVRSLTRRMSRANPLWGAPRIHGERMRRRRDRPSHRRMAGSSRSRKSVGCTIATRAEQRSTHSRIHVPNPMAEVCLSLGVATFRDLFPEP